VIANAEANSEPRLIVAFLEPFLREPFDLSDVGFRTYMGWFLRFRKIPACRWSVEEAYEVHGGEDRLETDVEIVESALSCDQRQ